MFLNKKFDLSNSQDIVYKSYVYFSFNKLFYFFLKVKMPVERFNLLRLKTQKIRQQNIIDNQLFVYIPNSNQSSFQVLCVWFDKIRLDLY